MKRRMSVEMNLTDEHMAELMGMDASGTDDETTVAEARGSLKKKKVRLPNDKSEAM